MNAEVGISCTFADVQDFDSLFFSQPFILFFFKTTLESKYTLLFSSSDLNLFNQPARLQCSDRWHSFLEKAKLKELLHISWFPGSLPAAGCDVIAFHAEQVNSLGFEFTMFWLRNSMKSLAGKCYCLTSR